jgi:hypothetical protein
MKSKLRPLSTLSVLTAICLAGVSAVAQSAAPTTPVGPGQTKSLGAAPNGAAPSQKMLNDALTPQTRQTLQQAMDSVDPATLAVPATKLSIGPGEAAELDGKKISPIAYSALPAPVRSALSGDARNTLSGAGK